MLFGYSLIRSVIGPKKTLAILSINQMENQKLHVTQSPVLSHASSGSFALILSSQGLFVTFLVVPTDHESDYLDQSITAITQMFFLNQEHTLPVAYESTT